MTILYRFDSLLQRNSFNCYMLFVINIIVVCKSKTENEHSIFLYFDRENKFCNFAAPTRIWYFYLILYTNDKTNGGGIRKRVLPFLCVFF